MALSRIWAAFILIAITVAGYKAFVGGDKAIFSRMVTGRADDPYDTVYYRATGVLPEADRKNIAAYGYLPADSAHAAAMLVLSDQRTSGISAAPFDSTSATLSAGAQGAASGVPPNATPSNTIQPDPTLSNPATDSNGEALHLYFVEANAKLPSLRCRDQQLSLTRHTDGLIETCKTAVNLAIGLVGIMALFMGLMAIAEQAGGIRLLSRMIGPFFSRLFPEVPKGHPALGHMMMNFSANLLGLDNAATPFGLKAMESLQELNPVKERASNAQIMFLCLHASGLTLIPVSIIASRAALKAHDPTDIFVPCMIATFAATMAAMIIVAVKQRINLLQPVILAWMGGLSALIAGLVVFLAGLNTQGVQGFSSLLSNGLILLIFLLIVGGGLYKKINLFDAFVSGAKEGFTTAVRIIPYLVGMLAAISLLRTSGAFDAAISGLKSLFAALGADTRFVEGLPTALIKPLSGSGARGLMVDTMKAAGPDSFAGRLACLLQGSSDTTFYVAAVYFGSVAVKNTRYAIGAMLLADLVGVISAVLLCYLFFG